MDTSFFSPFGLQQKKLADHLLKLYSSRHVDAEIANKVIAAVDSLSPTSFKTIQDRKLESFQASDRDTSHLEFCHHILKAVKLYTTFYKKDDRTIDTSEDKTEASRNILDIGSGSGAFAFVCNSLGHHATGMEHPRSNKAERLTQLNYLLSDWYDVRVIPHTIESRARLPVADATFDDFSILYPTFYRRWTELDWDFLLADLARCATKEHSKLYLRISKQKIKKNGEVTFSHGGFLKSVAKVEHSRIRDKCYVIDLT